MQNPCIGVITVIKFFRNERIPIRINDKVYYTNNSKRSLYNIVFKEGKYLTLDNIETGERVNNVRIVDVEPKNKNEHVTRTLGKVGVINTTYNGEAPKPNELWLASIADETHPGKNAGCFIVEPIKKLNAENVDRLLPGTFTQEVRDGVIFIKPNKVKDIDGDDIYWMLPITHRRGIEEAMRQRNESFYAIIVELRRKDV